MAEPWKVSVPDQHHDTEVYRRYQRSLRLSQFARDLAAWERVGMLDHPRYRERAAYRRTCIERWQDYLDGLIDPPPGQGRRTKRG